MGLFDFFQRNKRNIEDSDVAYVDDNTTAAVTLLADLRAQCVMNEAKALEIPAFSASLDFIAGLIAGLPIKLYRETKDENGTITTAEVTGDSRVALLNDSTGDLLTAHDAKQAFVRDALMHGAGYIFIKRKGLEVQSLHYVKQESVNVLLGVDPINKTAEINVNGVKYYPWDFLILARNTRDGITGRGLIHEHKTVLSTMYEELCYEQILAASGGNKKGFLQAEQKLSDEAMDSVKTAWRELYSKRESGVMVLNDGLNFTQASNTSMEMQLVQNKASNTAQIATMFGLNVDVISGKASEEQIVNAVKVAIEPILDSIIAAANNSLLLEAEKATMYFAFDLDTLLKADILKRYQAYEIGLRTNILQLDEIRYKEDLAPLGFNYYKLGLNDVLLDVKTGVIYTPNTNKAVQMNTEEANLTPINTESEVISDEVADTHIG